MEQTRDKLEGVQAESSDLSATIAEQNRAIDAKLGEVSALRQEQEAVEAELAEKQAELDRATEALEAEEAHLERVRAKLNRALDVLARAAGRDVRDRLAGRPQRDPRVRRLVGDGGPDRIPAPDPGIRRRGRRAGSRICATRSARAVERLDEQRAKIEAARDEIAAKEREVAAARAEAAARFGELKAEQAERQEALDALQSREAQLSDNLSAISEQIASEGGDATEGQMPAPLNPGQEAQLITESEASAPASAPQAVKDVVSAANAIATTPYIWGGGHGSFESSGYDCSGSVSYALHGGGLLESPLDSTGLSTWGEPGPGRWITVYANASHAWMVVAGISFDTSGGAGPRWHDPWASSPEGFVARHPAGL